VNCLDDRLHATCVTNGLSSGIDPCADRRVRHAQPTPNGFNKVVFGRQPTPLNDKGQYQVKHLRFEVNWQLVTQKQVLIRVDQAVCKSIRHGTLNGYWAALLKDFRSKQS
jgi:hypothetical protein